MKTNYIKKDILMIIILFTVFAVCFVGLYYYDLQTGKLEQMADSFYQAVITQ